MKVLYYSQSAKPDGAALAVDGKKLNTDSAPSDFSEVSFMRLGELIFDEPETPGLRVVYRSLKLFDKTDLGGRHG